MALAAFLSKLAILFFNDLYFVVLIAYIFLVLILLNKIISVLFKKDLFIHIFEEFFRDLDHDLIRFCRIGGFHIYTIVATLALTADFFVSRAIIISDKPFQDKILILFIINIICLVQLLGPITIYLKSKKFLRYREELFGWGSKFSYEYLGKKYFDYLYPTLNLPNVLKRGVIKKNLENNFESFIFYNNEYRKFLYPKAFLVVKLEANWPAPYFYFGKTPKSVMNKEFYDGSNVDVVVKRDPGNPSKIKVDITGDIFNKVDLELMIRPEIEESSVIKFTDKDGTDFELIAEKKLEMEVLQIFTQEFVDFIGTNWKNFSLGGYQNSFYIFIAEKVDSQEKFDQINAMVEYFAKTISEAGIENSMKNMRELKK